MKKTFFYTLFIIAVTFTKCDIAGENINGNGKVTSENRHISNAVKIKALGGMNVFVNSGPTGVKVEGEENVLPYIITETHNGWLEIRTRDNVNLHTTSPVKVYVTTPAIENLEVAGSGNITCNDKFSSNNNMSFKIAGSGDLMITVNSPKVTAEIAGSGNMHIKGETRDVEIHIAGSGNYDGPGLKAENANVNIAGSGDAYLFADINLKASIVGSGDVKYNGDAVVDKHIVGSGSVIKIR